MIEYRMDAREPRKKVKESNPDSKKPTPTGRSIPRSGDVLVSRRTARADAYAISVIPAQGRIVAMRYPEAIDRVRELALRLRVDGWYTCDHTHFACIARYRL